MDKKDSKKSGFIKEKIKEKPINKKSMMVRILQSMLCGIVGGIVAILVFMSTYPYFADVFGISQKQKVVLSEEVPTETETETEEEEITVQTPIVSLIMDKEKILQELFEIGDEASKSLVTVYSQKTGIDWFDESYEKIGTASGVLLADNGTHLLILTDQSVIKDAEKIQVEFVDESLYDGEAVSYDPGTGMAVVQVNKRSISEKTLREATTITLGTSMNIKKGTIGIAIGSPSGKVDSIRIGEVIGSSATEGLVDCQYQMLETNINKAPNGQGFLINKNKELMGVIRQEEENSIRAYGISDLRKLIEKLSNREEIPYLGILGTTVTEKISTENGIPMGVFVKGVDENSPAMKAGIKPGDVVVEINKSEIKHMYQYSSVLFSLKPKEKIELVIKRQSTDGYSRKDIPIEVEALK